MSDFNLLINGKMVPGDQTMPVLNPATEEVLAQCPRASKDQLDAAVAAAKAAFPAWAATPIEERRKLVGQMADAIEANTGELARLLTSEQGKPLADATGEVMGMAGFFRYLSSLDLPMRVIEDSGDRRVEAHRRPLGVIGAIIPWNYPLLILSFKLPSALLAGNTIVVKPAPTTPLSTLRFAELEGHPAQGRAQRHRRRQRPRRRHDQASGYPKDLVHRLDRDRPEGDGERGGDAEADHAGTRR
jgi:acyl-CoA reductase-like NAD-dependent aldehyde dehydrogenase